MWREIKLLAETKPVIASMSDVAASGGYYMAMAANAIVAENLTLTGSIGVVTGDLSFSTYQRESFVLWIFVQLSLSPSRHAWLLLFVLLVAARFTLAKLYEKIGFNKETISRGKYAELLGAEERPLKWVTSLCLLQRFYLVRL